MAEISLKGFRMTCTTKKVVCAYGDRQSQRTRRSREGGGEKENVIMTQLGLKSYSGARGGYHHCGGRKILERGSREEKEKPKRRTTEKTKKKESRSFPFI